MFDCVDLLILGSDDFEVGRFCHALRTVAVRDDVVVREVDRVLWAEDDVEFAWNYFHRSEDTELRRRV